MKKLLMTTALVALLPLPAKADLLYSQPLNNSTNGGEFSNDPGAQVVADRFSLPSKSEINQISWYGAGYFSPAFEGATDFNVKFYGDSAGLPGSLIVDNNVDLTITDTGMTNSFGDEVFLFTSAIPAFDAEAGIDYFVSISEASRSNFLWANSDLSCCAAQGVAGYPDSWFIVTDGTHNSQAFSLIGTPVPELSTWIMMLIGFAMLSYPFRKRWLV